MDFKKAIQISFASSSVAHSQCCANLLQWPLTEKQQENKTALKKHENFVDGRESEKKSEKKAVCKSTKKIRGISSN